MYLNIENLNVEIDKKHILNSVSLNIEKGQFFPLLGPSGCGKSTLLKTIAGILPKKSGKIFLNNSDLSQLPVHKRKTVIMFQDLRLFPHMNVAENIAFPLKMQGISKEESLEKALKLLEKVQLKSYDTRKISSLSGGEQQRVSLARALSSKPDLLLLDEPFTALDKNLREDMLALTHALHKEFHMTTILVTHDQQEALSMGDTIAIMLEGTILQQDKPEQVYSKPKTRAVADYFGDCEYFPGEIKNNIFNCHEISCPINLPNGKYEMMIRSKALLTEKPGPLKVQVKAIQFQGADYLITLDNGKNQWKKTSITCPSWEIGTNLSCSINFDEAVFFPLEK